MTNRVNLIEYALEINSFFAPYRQPEAVRQVVLRGAAVDGDRRQEEHGCADRRWEGRHSGGRDTYSAARCNVVGLIPMVPSPFRDHGRQMKSLTMDCADRTGGVSGTGLR